MGISHYLELDFSDADPGFERQLLARLWHAVHAIARTKSLRYQVSFPDWEDSVIDDHGRILSAGRCGSRMRLFAASQVLAEFEAELSGLKLVTGGLVTMSPITAVPAAVQGFARFLRSRLPEKLTAAYKERLARRVARRVAAGKAAQLHIDAVSERRRARLRETPVNFVALFSDDKGQVRRYSLCLVRQPSDTAALSENTFGLGGAAPLF